MVTIDDGYKKLNKMATFVLFVCVSRGNMNERQFANGNFQVRIDIC